MPDPKVLYVVAAVVVAGLAAWVAYVMATVKEQWARAEATERKDVTEAVEVGKKPDGEAAEAKEIADDEAKGDDAAKEEAKEDAKDDAKEEAKEAAKEDAKEEAKADATKDDAKKGDDDAAAKEDEKTEDEEKAKEA